MTNYEEYYVKPIFKEKIEKFVEEDKRTILFQENEHFVKKYQTVLTLLLILNEKQRLCVLAHDNLKKMIGTYLNLKNEWNLLRKELDKNFVEEKYLDLKFDSLKLIDLKIIEEEIKKIDNENDLTKMLYSLVELLKNLELEKTLLEEKYQLIKLPIEISVLEKEIEYLKNIKNKKKLIKTINDSFVRIENESNIYKVVSKENYIKNEEKRIIEKYQIIKDIEPHTIADYLIEFDNLSIKTVKITMPKLEVIDEEKQIELLKNNFNDYKEEDKTKLILLTSFLRNISCPCSEEVYQDLLNTLNKTANILLKIKLFKNIDLSSLENFNSSLKKLTENINEIPVEKLKCDLKMFLKSDELNFKNYLVGSLKKDNMPIYNNEGIIYKIILKKGTLVSFIDKELVRNIDDQLDLKQNSSLFLINLKKNIISLENSDIIKVIKINKFEQTIKNIMIVTGVKTEKIDFYKEIEVKGRK